MSLAMFQDKVVLAPLTGSDTRELGVLWRSLSFPCAVPEPVR